MNHIDKIAPVPKGEAPGTRKCVWCGSTNPAADKTCQKCGAVLPNSIGISPSVPDGQANALKAEAAEPTATASYAFPPSNIEAAHHTKKCFWCGAANTASVNICSQCGAVIPQSQPSNVSASRPLSGEDLALPSVEQNIGHWINSLGMVTPFASGHLRAQLAIIGLSVSALVEVVALLSTYLQIELISRVKAGQAITAAEVAANDGRELLIWLLGALVYIVTAVFFLMWIHRAHRNLPSLGAINLKYSPGWAVGGFFVPIMNLFRPYQVVKEIWRASSPDEWGGDGASWQRAPTPLAIILWWASWIVAGVLGRAVFRFSIGADTPDQLLTLSRLDVASGIVSIIAALLATFVVYKIDSKQEERIKRLTPQSHPPEKLL